MDRLTKADIRQIGAALDALAQEPPKSDIVKLTDRNNEYRLRVRDFRLLYKIKERKNTDGNMEKYIAVLKIAPRGQAYKE